MKNTVFLLLFLVFLTSSPKIYSQDSKNHQIHQLAKFDSLSEIYSQISLDTAIMYYRSGLKIADKILLNSSVVFKMQLRLGILYRQKGDFKQALACDIRALKIAEGLNDDGSIGTANNSIGIDYYRMNELEKAEVYFKTGLKYRIQDADSAGIADSYYNLGMIYDDLEKKQLSLTFYNMALQIFMQQEIEDGMADVYNGLAGLHYKTGNIDSVGYFARKAYEIYEVSGNKEMMSFMSINIAGLYNMQKKHNEALEFIQKGISIAGELGMLSQLRQGYKAMSETYAYLGDYQKAYENYELYTVFKDSVFNIDKARAFDELMTRYQTEKKERLLEQSENKVAMQNIRLERNRVQRNLFIGVFIMAAIVLALLSWRFFEKRRTARLLNRQNDQLKQINAAKDKFFSIISHDLRSPVSSFQRLTAAMELSFDKIEREKLRDYVTELNKSSKNIHELLNNLLYWSMSQSGGLMPRNESFFIEDLIRKVTQSENTNASVKNISVEISTNENFRVFADPMMLETVLRNVLSNAIKFSPDHSVINISVERKDMYALVRINDSGPGLNAGDVEKLFKIQENVKKIGSQPEKKGAGLGLILCREFMKLNGGKIYAEANQKGGRFIIEIKLTEEQKTREK